MFSTFIRSVCRNSLNSYALRCCQRNISTTKLQFQKEDDAGDVQKLITADLIFHKDNRQRFMQDMKNSPPVGIKLGRVKSENTFAAVLICICTDAQGELSLLYTRRSPRISRHVRQISFPGGIKDSTDTDFIDCALRETEEEIGLPRSRIQIWGTGKLITPPHTAAIMPVIGSVHEFHLNELEINEDEVEEAFVIPLSKLAEPTTLHYTQYRSGYSAPAFVVGHYKIWGITGFLTHNFMNCLLPHHLNRHRKRVKYVKPFKPHKVQ